MQPFACSKHLKLGQYFERKSWSIVIQYQYINITDLTLSVTLLTKVVN